MKLFTEADATFSACEKYRYRLWRRWSNEPKLTYILLNPSTATADVDDPTVGRCHARAMREGFGAFEVVNLFALRSTDPKVLRLSVDPVGPLNDSAILDACADAGRIVCAWGKHGSYLGRDSSVLALLDTRLLHCLGRNKDGTPKHPLYLKSDCQTEQYL